MKFFLHIAFNGIEYHGWQRQNEVLSVREVLEACLTKILKENVECIGCGRTDTQVHASQYFLHFTVEKMWDFDLIFRLNKALPKDIAAFDVIPVPDNAHARFDATSRTYDYFVHTTKDPFLDEKSTYYWGKELDPVKIKEAVALLTHYTDYRAFCLKPDKQNTTICKVTDAQLYVNSSGTRLRFQISANRFLRGMIRITMSRLLAIGNGSMGLNDFEQLLITGNIKDQQHPENPQGLYLSRIMYPYIEIPPRTDIISLLQTGLDKI